MRQIDVKIQSGKSYRILIGEGFICGKSIRAALDSAKFAMIVSDENLQRLYGGLFQGENAFILPPGEEHKTLVNVERICRAAANTGLDRKSLMLAFGGGVVGDMAGFAASIYMRGIEYIQMPTTLLAMVDSSVGGKTGVDLPEGKNLIGTFWQPAAVFADIAFLKTLPIRELRCGLAEVIKYGVILDENLFSKLESSMQKLLALDSASMEEIIARCCELKAQVVEQDEKEGGLRAILNYGHTFGHAIEKVCGYGNLSHGEAVAVGMRMAAKFAVLSGIFSPEMEQRQNSLLDAIGLPLSVNAEAEKIYNAMFSDKKASVGKLKIIVPERIGKVKEVINPPKEIILKSIEAYLK